MSEESYAKFCKNMNLFEPFEPNTKIAIALSGGIDSMALVILTNKWLKNSNRGSLIALTVNHNLQKSSQADSKKVGMICQGLGIEHQVLDWKHDEITSNVQSQAREARYNLLKEYCLKEDILHLFIAQHLEDKIENFFIKLSRSSGIFGLTENKIMFLQNIRICKPLFNFTKFECENILNNLQSEYVQDISNFQTKYFRNQIRSNIQNVFTPNTSQNHLSLELFQKRTAKSIDHLANSAALIQSKIIQDFCNCVTIKKEGFAVLSKEFRKCAVEVQHYILNYLLTIISGRTSSPRALQIDKILQEFANNKLQTQTLNKCVIKTNFDTLIIYKEWYDIDKRPAKLRNNLLWDNRFFFTLDQQLDQELKNYELIVSHLNEAMYKEIDLTKVNLKIDKKILFTLPVIKTLEKVIAIPTIKYYDLFKNISKENIICSFTPKYFAKVMHLEY